MKAKILLLAGIAVWITTLALTPAAKNDDRDRRDEHGRDDHGRDDHGRDDRDPRIEKGFDIAPVQLRFEHKKRDLVGLGSYLVNATGDCNGCHAGPSGQFAPGGDPAQGQPKIINQAAYLQGGNTELFGPFIPRNLTPDYTHRAEGGGSFEEFRDIMRTGIDPDHAHPQFGPYLQVMPWPAFQNMTDHDLRAIYEYLSAIPCIEGDPGLPDPRPIGTRCHHS
jgi:hypothetical protein